MELKKNIQKRLREQNKTQVDLCKDLGVTSQSLQYYFRGNITLSKLSEIAAALNCQPWELITPADILQVHPRDLLTPIGEDKPTPQQNAINCPYCGKPLTIAPACAKCNQKALHLPEIV